MRPFLPFFLLLLALSTGFAQETVPVDWWDTLCETHPPCTADRQLDSTQIPFYTALYDSLPGEEWLVPYHRYDLLQSNAKTEDWSDSAFIYRLNDCCNCLARMMFHIHDTKERELWWNRHLALGDTVYVQWVQDGQTVSIDLSGCEMYCIYTDTNTIPLKVCPVETFPHGFIHPGIVENNDCHFILKLKKVYYYLPRVYPGWHMEISNEAAGKWNENKVLSGHEIDIRFVDTGREYRDFYRNLHQYSQRNKKLLRAVKELLR